MKKVLFCFIIANFYLCCSAQVKLLGTVSTGAQYDQGSIFSVDSLGCNQTVLHDFYAHVGSNPASGLLMASDGKYYGLTTYGGVSNNGILFQYDPQTEIYLKKIDFDYVNGRYPVGALIQASDGMLYGTTKEGGTNGFGTLFQYNCATGVLTKKADITDINGREPTGTLVEASDGNLYGMAKYGGTTYTGILFQFNPLTNVLTKKVDFGGTNGEYPYGHLTKALDGNLYGMTSYGGSSTKGVVFQYNPLTNVYSKKVDFVGSNGSTPHGALAEAPDGNLYGMTSEGGTNNVGVIFRYNSSLNVFTKMHDFVTGVAGSVPSGTLMVASDGMLYGMTAAGGSYANGVLFQFDYNGAGTYIKKIDLSTVDGTYANGPLIEASNGVLYGTAASGGIYYSGVFFQYDIGGNLFTKKFEFGSKLNGANTAGSLKYATNGKIYGTTQNGGVNNKGVLFEFDPITNSYTKKIDFDGVNYGANPLSTLMEATDGMLYGTTNMGGLYNSGTIFQYDPNTNACIKKHDFNLSDGANPSQAMIQASNGNLYGVADSGGVNWVGVLFQYDITTSVYTKKLDFNASGTGSYPCGMLTEMPDAKLYGLTKYGGINNKGVLFQYDPLSNVLVKKVNFSTNGMYPIGSLTKAFDGKLYGLTSYGGINGDGVLFNYDAVANIYTKKIDLNYATGSGDCGPMLCASDSMLYGMFRWGGINGKGVVFRYDPFNNIYTKTIDFNGQNGAYPINNGFIEFPIELVYPGDANYDGIANNNDLLELGLRYGAVGTPRSTVSNNWQGYLSAAWGTDTVSTGYNLKHADCNGDGTINFDDTLAINLNYGLTHALRLGDINKTNTTGDIYFGSAQLGYGVGQQVAIDVYLGESTNPLQNFYGAAFTIDYNDNTLVQPGSLSFSIDNTSWVGTINTDVIRLTKTMEASETIDAAICKTNHLNTSGSGKIGTLRFIASSTIGNFSVTASNAYYIDNTATQTPLTSATYTVNINTAVGLQNQTSNSSISIYPNPSNGSFTLSNLNTREEYNLEVKDMLGRTVYTDVIKSNSSKANIKLNQAAGVYWLQISSKQGGAEVHKVVVE